jgi:hypothetical protein
MIATEFGITVAADRGKKRFYEFFMVSDDNSHARLIFDIERKIYSQNLLPAAPSIRRALPGKNGLSIFAGRCGATARDHQRLKFGVRVVLTAFYAFIMRSASVPYGILMLVGVECGRQSESARRLP